jgi:hypothetical protein
MRFSELELLYIHESLIFPLGSCTELDDFGLPIAKRGGIMAYIYRSLIIEVNSRGRCCPPGRAATLIGSAAPLHSRLGNYPSLHLILLLLLLTPLANMLAYLIHINKTAHSKLHCIFLPRCKLRVDLV